MQFKGYLFRIEQHYNPIPHRQECHLSILLRLSSNFRRSMNNKSVVPLESCEPFVTKDGSLIRELLSHRNSTIRKQSLAEATVPPRTSTDAHYHPMSEEIYYILEGTATMVLGDRSFLVRPGDAIAIPPGIVHWLDNAGFVPLRLLCCCSPGYEHDDTVMVDRVIADKLVEEKMTVDTKKE